MVAFDDNGALKDMSAPVICNCRLRIRSVKALLPKKHSCDVIVLPNSPIFRPTNLFTSSMSELKC